MAKKNSNEGRVLAVMNMDLDIQMEGCFSRGRDHGTYRLWLTVTLQAATQYKRSRGRDEQARSFLFDENPFLEEVCEQLEIDPDAVRERIKKDYFPRPLRG